MMLQKKNIKEHNPNWPQNPDHPYRMLIIGASGSGKANLLFNLINQQPDIDNIYLYAKDSYEAKYQLSISKRESTGLTYFNDCKAFIECSVTWMIFIKLLKHIIQIGNVKF